MKHISLILLFFVSAIVKAGSGWSQTGQIVEVYNHGYSVLVRMSGIQVDYGDCESTYYYAIDNDDPEKLNLIFSQILMAHAAGKSAQFWINGDKCSGPNDKYQTISTLKTFQS